MNNQYYILPCTLVLIIIIIRIWAYFYFNKINPINWLKEEIKKSFEVKKPVVLTEATYDHKKELLIINYSDGSSESYHHTTRWNKLPYMTEVNNDIELELYRIFKYIKYHKMPYPNGHKIKEEYERNNSNP